MHNCSAPNRFHVPPPIKRCPSYHSSQMGCIGICVRNATKMVLVLCPRRRWQITSYPGLLTCKPVLAIDTIVNMIELIIQCWLRI